MGWPQAVVQPFCFMQAIGYATRCAARILFWAFRQLLCILQFFVQEVNERKSRAHSRGVDSGETHSTQLPSHWDPMRPDEDHRLADLSLQPDDEYRGDLEGWQVTYSKCAPHVHVSCIQSLWRGVMPCVRGIKQRLLFRQW